MKWNLSQILGELMGLLLLLLDEIKNAQDTGKYERPVIRYEDGMFNGYETVYEGEQLTHVPTQHKIVRVEV
jgi:hypothetical protein